MAPDYESACERRDLLYGRLASLDERRGAPLRHPLLDAMDRARYPPCEQRNSHHR